ncbi:MAG: ATP-binding protein [Gammaproteobacteria bacterium]|nr:ATP-binding protein [Gammaproteobacteria bacterium]
MNAFRREALQDFVIQGEKSPPPVFIGRQDILDNILSPAKLSGRKGNASAGNTRIIQGAPGAGKSSILSELATRSNQQGYPRIIKISNIHLLQALPNVLRALAFAGSAPKENWLNALALFGEKWIQKIGNISAFGFEVSLGNIFENTPPQDLLSLEEYIPAEKWHTPVIVAVDEAQRLPVGTDSPSALFLQAIHDAETALPLTLVIAGLGDTQSRMRSLGLTHGIRAHHLGCFTKDECTELMSRFCDCFGIRIGDCTHELCTLSQATDGWPRHMHWAQQAVAEAVLELGIDGNLNRIADWAKVQARSDVLRQGYYSSQFSNEMAFSRKLIARVMFEVGKAQIEGEILQEDDVRKKIKIFSEKDQNGDCELPAGFSPQDLVTHLIHCGALQEDPGNHDMKCPIPSFQGYIIRRGGLDTDQLAK